mgnify:CR=1 FL=1
MSVMTSGIGGADAEPDGDSAVGGSAAGFLLLAAVAAAPPPLPLVEGAVGDAVGGAVSIAVAPSRHWNETTKSPSAPISTRHARLCS